MAWKYAGIHQHRRGASCLRTAPQQYRLQFGTSEEHVWLVERAKALLARTSPRPPLGELHERAMRLLVEQLEKEKLAVTERPRAAKPPVTAKAKAKPEAKLKANSRPRESGATRQRGRDVLAALQRDVYARDAGRCGYVDERGVRCRETRYLELHHLNPFGKDGEHVADNLALRCAAHNALAAEEDFGREQDFRGQLHPRSAWIRG